MKASLAEIDLALKWGIIRGSEVMIDGERFVFQGVEVVETKDGSLIYASFLRKQRRRLIRYIPIDLSAIGKPTRSLPRPEEESSYQTTLEGEYGGEAP